MSPFAAFDAECARLAKLRRDADQAGNAEAWEVADAALDRQLAARAELKARLADIEAATAATMVPQ